MVDTVNCGEFTSALSAVDFPAGKLGADRTRFVERDDVSRSHGAASSHLIPTPLIHGRGAQASLSRRGPSDAASQRLARQAARDARNLESSRAGPGTAI